MLPGQQDAEDTLGRGVQGSFVQCFLLMALAFRMWSVDIYFRDVSSDPSHI